MSRFHVNCRLAISLANMAGRATAQSLRRDGHLWQSTHFHITLSYLPPVVSSVPPPCAWDGIESLNDTDRLGVD